MGVDAHQISLGPVCYLNNSENVRTCVYSVMGICTFESEILSYVYWLLRLHEFLVVSVWSCNDNNNCCTKWHDQPMYIHALQDRQVCSMYYYIEISLIQKISESLKCLILHDVAI